MNQSALNPKYLVVGQGSMGTRRLRCLLANGIRPEQILVFDKREDRLSDAQNRFGVQGTTCFENAVCDPAVEAVFISVPGFLHMQFCLAAANAGKHWFCEVPLTTDLDGISELQALTISKGLVGAPGCQVLFHPLGMALKEWAEGPTGGDVLSASYSFGSYLPEWHPHEDYRTFYASNMALGGGNLDVIAQELVWIRWIINRPICNVFCKASKLGKLELAAGTPDHQEMIIEFEGRLMLSMHFDLLDRSHERVIRLVTDNSTLKWSNLDDGLRIFDNRSSSWALSKQPDGYVYESCYIEEIGRFLMCIRERRTWPISLDHAQEIVRVLVALRESISTGRVVNI